MAINFKTLNSGLTKGQAELVSEVSKFLKSNLITFTISGYAGTGKSYITNHIIKNLLKDKKVAVTAPTHRAVRVIENFTGKRGHTLHSLHGLRPNYSLDEFNIDNIKYESIGNVKFQEYDVIFIDEASMISKDLKKLNDIRAKQFKTKLIYLGDEFQLPPVKEDRHSEVFDTVDVKYTLTEVIRQKDSNPLLDMFDLLREDIPTNGASFLNHIKTNRSSVLNNEGYEVLTINDTKTKMLEMFKSEEFTKDLNYCRYGGFTNEAVALWNSYIRAVLYPTNDLIVVGDLLTGYKTIIDNNNVPVITNSSDYRVISSTRRISDLGFACYNVTVLSLDNDKVTKLSIIDHTDNTFKVYYEIINKLHRTAHFSKGIDRSENFKKYFAFKDAHLCMITFPLNDGSVIRGWVNKEIYYGYGVTIHKLQGSTLKNIFLDALDIAYVKMNHKTPRVNNDFNPTAISMRNRLLYTGLTRVSNKAYIIL